MTKFVFCTVGKHLHKSIYRPAALLVVLATPSLEENRSVEKGDRGERLEGNNMIISKDLLVLGDYLRLPKNTEHTQIQ